MRLLLVEDEPTLADSIRRGLEAEGMSVDHELDGQDGLWRAREGEYDAIVLDIMLPGLNGYEICRQLREDEVWTPVLMLTAKDGEYDEADAFDLGADDYLRKPFSFVVLVARIRALVRRGLTARPSTLTHADLTFDPASMRCQRGDTSIELTQREGAVLETLLRRSPNVVPKHELLDSVWGMDFEGDPNIVEVYVGYVRRKIDRPFETKTVKTVRGLGYQIAAAT
ncbi:MAG: response regulator transcription factor [Acidimicrobiales bacterium]|nr:response regulator transcription factor [Acidimicrobiales bacterium]RZV43098.1 MAG: response regulator transcription factor [Acidimicrobiales bacterium]